MRRASVTILGASVALAILAGPASAQPTNDDFANATSVATVPSFDSADVTDATLEPGEPDEDCAPVANTVWYALTLDAATEVAVDTEGSDYDTVLGVYTGTDVGDLELVTCNDDDLGLQARVAFAAEAGTTYWIQVAAFDELIEGGGQLTVAFRRSTLDGVTCDAEVDDLDDFPLYIVAPGDTVECLAPALDADQPADWQVEFIDYEQDLPLEAAGEDGVDPDPDGVLAFSFTVPDEIVFGEFDAVVTQGQDGAESYREPVSGLIQGEVVDPDLDCDPDPATPGDTVECIVEQLRPRGEFYWFVEFLDAEQAAEVNPLLDDLDEAMSDVAEGELQGGDLDDLAAEVEPLLANGVDVLREGFGEADEDGVGRLRFDVPDDADIVAYRVVAFSDLGGFAVYEGNVEAALPVPETPEPDDEPPGPTPVPRPARIDTGAGGAVPTDPIFSEGTPPLRAVIVLAVLAMLATVPARWATRR